MRAHPREMAAFTICMVSGWKSALGSMVEITILAVGNVSDPFSAILMMDSATRSCCVLRSFVPTWMMMWVGSPKWFLFNCSITSFVLGHQILVAF